MTICPKCPASGAARASTTLALCADHALQALGEIRALLASTVSSLQRAAGHADRVLDSRDD